MTSYADAVSKARGLISEARLADPDEHFPYKHEAVLALLEENPPAGPEGPDDDRVRVSDMISEAIADGSRDYVEAQAAYLADPNEETRATYEVARDVLVEARKRHRANRGDGMAVIGFRGAE